MKQAFFVTFLLLSFWSQAQSPIGTWKTIDDETGEAKSYVQLYERNGKIYGKITDLLQKPDDTLCDACEGDKHNKPVVGMVIIDGLTASKNTWRGANILDPESGNYYACSIWFEDGNGNELFLRGKHWTGIYRTQKWYRVK